MPGKETEACAAICDAMVEELEAIKKSMRRTRHDRNPGREVDYAIRAVKRVAERIRARASLEAPAPPDQ
jgi:hypothetical protein